MFLFLWRCCENCAPKFTSLRNIHLDLLWFHVIPWHLCLKWWDRWVPQSFYWGIFVLTCPVFTPTLLVFGLVLESLIQPSETYTPKLCRKKDLCRAAAHRQVVNWQLLLFRMGIIWDVVCWRMLRLRFSRSILFFSVLLVRVSRFYRSLCSRVCMHGFLSLE
jgi:hypothetical protein